MTLLILCCAKYVANLYKCRLTFTVGVIICVTLLFICTVFLIHHCFYHSLVNKDFQNEQFRTKNEVHNFGRNFHENI